MSSGTAEPSTDHKIRGLQKLLWQFQRPKLMALLGTWLDAIQQTEDFAVEVRANCFSIASELDFVLDRIGKIVGRGRNGRTNAAYRVALRAQIRINRSSGTIEDMLAVARLSVNDPTVTFELIEDADASMQIIASGLFIDLVTLFQNLVATKAAGVYLEFVFSAGSEDDNDFQFTSDDQGDDGRDMTDITLGFGDTTDVTTGGHFVGVFAA